MTSTFEYWTRLVCWPPDEVISLLILNTWIRLSTGPLTFSISSHMKWRFRRNPIFKKLFSLHFSFTHPSICNWSCLMNSVVITMVLVVVSSSYDRICPVKSSIFSRTIHFNYVHDCSEKKKKKRLLFPDSIISFTCSHQWVSKRDMCTL